LTASHGFAVVKLMKGCSESTPSSWGSTRRCLRGAAASSLRASPSINYLAVRLKAGASWRYQRPTDHTVAWVALSKGGLTTPERIEAGELAVFEPADTAIDFYAYGETEFVLGSAVAHRHDLVLGYYSVHTSQASLAAGERRIDEIRMRLQKEGRLQA
jgi:redox-sensitive bicupin YhaK (pirin superfamily)